MEVQMNRIWLACALALLSIEAMTAQFRVKIVDAVTEKPLQDVKVLGWFSNDNGWKAWTESAPEYVDNGVTDKNGKCRLSGKTNTGKVGFIVKEPPSGYYPSPNVRLQLPRNMLGNLQGLVTGGPEELLRLDRIVDPVPLSVKRLRFPYHKFVEEINDVEKGVFSYDFIKQDWLPPWGAGEYADVRIRRLPRDDLGQGTNFCGEVDKAFRDRVVFDFLGDGNGVVVVPVRQDAGIKIRLAPESGYSSHYEQVRGVGKDLKLFNSCNKERCLCFRIRTKVDPDGRVVGGHYGKIYGDIWFNWSYLGVSSVSLLYYLNPTPLDRNLEWDMKNNLCPNPGKIGQFQP